MPKYYLQIGDHEYGFDLEQSEAGATIRPIAGESEAAGAEAQPIGVDFAPVHFSADTGEGLYSILADNMSFQVYVENTEEGLRMVMWRHRFDVKVQSEREWRLEKIAPRTTVHTGALIVKAPMPGLVKGVLVQVGDEVKAGQRMLVLEAMKMENDINAPRDGRITAVNTEGGAVVEGGKPLLTLE
ncbi:MAG: biotin/lipoyl-binding protein [Chloroflexi bacterium]|nr:biotin/lipoyl-binding protein [Chloroflexota bacterium]